jgi:hypothetical protein
MWAGTIVITIIKEIQLGPANPGYPLPRPCKFVPEAIGYSGLGLLATLMPGVAFLVAIGITIGSVTHDAGVLGVGSTVLTTVSSTINRTTARTSRA